ncbi:MAG: hypothetical protein ABR520_11765 [Mycobacteriales bacterium]|nr:hypothetical protein [Frankia sp.]
MTTSTLARADAPSARTRGRGAARTERPRLSVVPAAAPRARRAPFVLLTLGVLAVGLVALLLLNTLVGQDAFRLHDLARRAAVLQEQQEALEQEVVALDAPGALAARAAKLGMVPAGGPAFLRLSDGKILGDARPAGVVTRPSPGAATAHSSPHPTPRPSAQPSSPPTPRPTPSPTR